MPLQLKQATRPPGSTKPPPVFSRRQTLKHHAAQLGGASVPVAKPRPKSLLLLPSTRQPVQELQSQVLPPPAPRLAPSVPVSAPLKLTQARVPRSNTSLAAAQTRAQMQAQLWVLINLVGEHCQLYLTLSHSKHPDQQLSQMLASYAASALYRYISSSMAFADFTQSQHAPCNDLPIALVADFLYAASASQEEDRAVHRTSASAAVKSLRWLAKHLQWMRSKHAYITVWLHPTASKSPRTTKKRPFQYQQLSWLSGPYAAQRSIKPDLVSHLTQSIEFHPLTPQQQLDRCRGNSSSDCLA